jgi:hypothetical protein
MKMKAEIMTVCLLAAISLASCRDHLIPGDEPGLTSAATVNLSSVTTDLGDPNEDYTDNTWVLRL